MMSSLAGGKMPAGMPAMPGMPATRKPAAKPQKKKGGRGVSGNPAKRNAPRPERAAVDPAAAFGAAASTRPPCRRRMAEFELPPELRNRFGQ